MAPKVNRYKNLEQLMSGALILAAVMFIIFLIAAGNGIGWLKVTAAIIAILASLLSIAFLALTKELLRRRSFWMTVGFAAIILCTIVSLLCNYPSPNELKSAADGFDPAAVGAILLP